MADVDSNLTGSSSLASTGFFGFFSRFNPNLLVPVAIVFLLMRLKSVCNVSLRLMSGLKMFTKKLYAPSTSSHGSTDSSEVKDRELSPSDMIDKAIAKLQLTMVEVEDTPSILHLMKSQLFYDTYDSMIYLCLSSLCAYGWSLAYSCYSPQSSSTVSYCWIVLIILVLVLYSVQTLLQIVYLTGFVARETQLAWTMGAVVCALSLALFFMHCSYVSDATAEAITIHINALVMQLDGSIVLLSTDLLKPILYFALSILLSLIAMGLVIPAVRFASTFNKIIHGPGATLLTTYKKSMLFIDIAVPLLVAILYSSIPELLFSSFLRNHNGGFSSSGASMESSCRPSDEVTCPSVDANIPNSSRSDCSGYEYFESSLLIAQLVVVVIMVLVRWANLRAHLQTHLDSLVTLIAAQIVAPDVSEESIAMLQLKVKLCTGYLMAAACQYIAVPLFALACTLLLHLSSPTGTGACYGLYNIAGWDTSSLIASIDYMSARNTTAIAIETASSPYFTDVLVSLAGISMMGQRDLSTTSKASDFFVKLSAIFGLPHAAAVSLCRSLICMHSLVWGLCYVTAIAVWRYYPSIFVGGGGRS